MGQFESRVPLYAKIQKQKFGKPTASDLRLIIVATHWLHASKSDLYVREFLQLESVLCVEDNYMQKFAILCVVETKVCPSDATRD